MRASLVIPCYNEALGLPSLVERCRAVAESGRTEIVLVDNGSTDATPAVLPPLLHDAPGLRSVRIEKNLGYGYGILTGLAAASGDILGWTHADLQTDPMDFIRALDIAAPEPEPKKVYVKGARFGRPLSDVAFTMAMSVSETLLMGTALRDINAQPNVFHRDFYASWADKAPYDFSLDLFVYVMAKRAGLTVKRFPVRFGERNFGRSHWNVDWRSKYKFIKRTITYSLDLRQKLSQG